MSDAAPVPEHRAVGEVLALVQPEPSSPAVGPSGGIVGELDGDGELGVVICGSTILLDADGFADQTRAASFYLDDKTAADAPLVREGTRTLRDQERILRNLLGGPRRPGRRLPKDAECIPPFGARDRDGAMVLCSADFKLSATSGVVTGGAARFDDHRASRGQDPWDWDMPVRVAYDDCPRRVRADRGTAALRRSGEGCSLNFLWRGTQTLEAAFGRAVFGRPLSGGRRSRRGA